MQRLTHVSFLSRPCDSLAIYGEVVLSAFAEAALILGLFCVSRKHNELTTSSVRENILERTFSWRNVFILNSFLEVCRSQGESDVYWCARGAACDRPLLYL